MGKQCIVFTENLHHLFERRLLGIVTKKDMLRHVASMENMDPDSIRYH